MLSKTLIIGRIWQVLLPFYLFPASIYTVGSFLIWRSGDSHWNHQQHPQTQKDMAATATPGTRIVAPKPCISAPHRISRSRIGYFGNETKGLFQTKFRSLSFMSATQPFCKIYDCNPLKSERHVIKAMSGTNDKQPLPGLPVDLRGRISCFIHIHCYPSL